MMLIRLLLLTLVSFNSYAWTWKDLWLTPDQQAQQLMEKKQYKQAQSLFQQPDWQASAAYRSENYQQAAAGFAALNHEQGFYNQGNALAKAGQYEAAIAAYDKALSLNSGDKDAVFNRQLVADLLKKQKKSPNQNNKSPQQKDQQKSQQDKADNSQQDNQSGQQPDKSQDQSPQQSGQQEKDKQKQAEKPGEQQPKDKQQSKKETGDKAPQSLAEQEKQQAKEQWLRLIPDDPGGLLREKFLRDHIRRQRGWYQ